MKHCTHISSKDLIQREGGLMKPMIWRPEENDQKVNQYLDRINHAPYLLIIGLSIGLFCLFSLLVLVGIF
jgi:hypothetical protein